MEGVCVMKKVLLCLVFILGFGLPAWAANFAEICRDENYLIYLDIDSISERTSYGHNYVVAWTKWIPRGDSHKELLRSYGIKSVGYIMQLFAFDQNMEKIQALSVNVYDKKGNVVDRYSGQFSVGKYEEVVPQTYGELMYNLVIYTYLLD